jgi:hypothetical protein
MIYGWDISTSIIGLSIFNADGTYVASQFLDLRKADFDLISKGQLVEEWISDEYVVNPYFHNIHYIEDSLGGFAMGRTMMQTLMKLGSFNTLVSWLIWKSSKNPKLCYIHPSTVKAIMKRAGLLVPKGADKKQLTLDFVSRVQHGFCPDLNRNGKPQPWCYDMADSYCIAKAGMSRDAQGEKAPGDPTDSGS